MTGTRVALRANPPRGRVQNDLVPTGLINFGAPELAGHRPGDWSALAASSQVTGGSVAFVPVPGGGVAG